MNLLDSIVELSHEFGSPEYLKGGGGNTSAKNDDTLWVKPSGTTLADLRPESFVAMSRAKLAELYEVTPPTEACAREALVKDLMMAAVQSESLCRPSVEAPLHNSFSATYVVHTHPPLINGMTCANDGAETCRTLFSDALWIDYTDPGYTLSMRVREEIRAHAVRRGREPETVFLANHGVIVVGNMPERIREVYSRIMNRLRDEYQKAGIAMELKTGPMPSPETIKTMTKRLRELLGKKNAAYVCADGKFRVAAGPVTPDHIVYMKSHPFFGEPTLEAVSAFCNESGYAPRVISCDEGVFGLGTSEKNATLVLEMAKDSALVEQFAGAFGGIRYMSQREQDFIDNWEVEAYRRKVVADS